MCKVYDISGAYRPENYIQNGTERVLEPMSGKVTRLRPKDKDYELEQPVQYGAVQRKIIDGLCVSVVPVKVNGRVLYDTSIASDGRLLYWKTVTTPPKAFEDIIDALKFCKANHKAEQGIHGTYFDEVLKWKGGEAHA